MMNYHDSIRGADAFTRKMGWTSPIDHFPNKPSPSILHCIDRSALNDFMAPHLDDLGALKCLNLSISLYHYLWKHGYDCFLTAGYLRWKGINYFSCSDTTIEEWKKNGVPNVHDINIHAWCTLMSGEVIDASFLTSYALVTGESRFHSQIIYWNEAIPNDFQYFPLLLGDDWIADLGLC